MEPPAEPPPLDAFAQLAVDAALSEAAAMSADLMEELGAPLTEEGDLST